MNCTIPVTAAEKAELEAACAALGIDVSSVMRGLVARVLADPMVLLHRD